MTHLNLKRSLLSILAIVLLITICACTGYDSNGNPITPSSPLPITIIGGGGGGGMSGALPATNGGVPSGGTTGQVLSKIDGTNYNTQWETPSGGGSSTVLHALADIQVVPADTVSVTTCVSNANFYEPALQGRLTSNAVYKRFVSVKVSASTNTAGTVTIQLYDVTTSAQLAVATLVYSSGNVNTEKAIAATNTSQQVTNLSDVVTIRIKHSVSGATVQLNSGGLMEADNLIDTASSGLGYLYVPSTPPAYCWYSSCKMYVLAGLSTATITYQASYGTSNIGYGAQTYSLYGSPSNSENTLSTITPPTIKSSSIYVNVSAKSGDSLIGFAIGISADNQ
jgi:hypothetical protein